MCLVCVFHVSKNQQQTAYLVRAGANRRLAITFALCNFCNLHRIKDQQQTVYLVPVGTNLSIAIRFALHYTIIYYWRAIL